MDKRQRVLDISKKLGLSHIGSCLSILPILEEIYTKKRPEDKVLLCGAHSHLSHLLFIDPDNAEEKIKKDIHCNKEAGCDINGGSLGHAGGIAVGMAIANPDIDIYLVDTDGSLQEGSCWEAFRIMTDLNLKNIKVYVNCNGYTATSVVDMPLLAIRIGAFCPSAKICNTQDYQRGEFDGVAGHYLKAT